MQRILRWCLLKLTFISLSFCKSYLELPTINKSVIIIIIMIIILIIIIIITIIMIMIIVIIITIIITM